MKEILITCYDTNDLNGAIRKDINELSRTSIHFKVELNKNMIHIYDFNVTLIYTTLTNIARAEKARRLSKILYSNCYTIEEIIKEVE